MERKYVIKHRLRSQRHLNLKEEKRNRTFSHVRIFNFHHRRNTFFRARKHSKHASHIFEIFQQYQHRERRGLNDVLPQACGNVPRSIHDSFSIIKYFIFFYQFLFGKEGFWIKNKEIELKVEKYWFLFKCLTFIMLCKRKMY